MSVAPIQSTALAGAEPLSATERVRAAQLKGSALRNATPAAQRTAVAAQFEAILVRQLLGKTMNSMLGGSEGGVASSVYGDMLSETIAQQLTAGQGLGIGRVLEQQLAPRTFSAPTSSSNLPRVDDPTGESRPAGATS